jgi:hypothetical protein
VTLSQPRAIQIYYECAAKIDQHNRDRQATLGVEKKVVTPNWDESGKPIETMKSSMGIWWRN